MIQTFALFLAAALALPAFADDAVVAPVADAAVIETAKLDPAVIEESASLELFGMSNAASTALVFVLIAVTVTIISNGGDSEGVPP